MSFGLDEASAVLQTSINTALENDLILVAAAGNDGQNTATYPAAYDGVISVGASNKNDEIASFSNHGILVDIVAPGVSVTAPSDDNSTINPSYDYESRTGTSVSTAFVSGTLALAYAEETFERFNRKSKKRKGFFNNLFGTGKRSKKRATEGDPQIHAMNSIFRGTDVISQDKFVNWGRLNVNEAMKVAHLTQRNFFTPEIDFLNQTMMASEIDLDSDSAVLATNETSYYEEFETNYVSLRLDDNPELYLNTEGSLEGLFLTFYQNTKAINSTSTGAHVQTNNNPFSVDRQVLMVTDGTEHSVQTSTSISVATKDLSYVTPLIVNLGCIEYCQ